MGQSGHQCEEGQEPQIVERSRHNVNAFKMHMSAAIHEA